MKNFAIYKCKLCGEIIKEELTYTEEVEIAGTNTNKKYLISPTEELQPYAIETEHICEDGSLGILEFLGVKVEKQDILTTKPAKSDIIKETFSQFR